ncbi:MAG: hypothetical protein IPP66_18625 [Anaerolineales bacterium]|nr:hypothetical protein [Anaerolineales bacterium]
MIRRIRVILGVLILAVSIALLIWAYKPLDRTILTQPVSPSNLQLPTPTSLLIYPNPVS